MPWLLPEASPVFAFMKSEYDAQPQYRHIISACELPRKIREKEL
jgi:hypothetical protein